MARNVFVDFFEEVAGESINAVAGISRAKVWCEAPVPIAFKLTLKGFENRAGIHESMN